MELNINIREKQPTGYEAVKSTDSLEITINLKLKREISTIDKLEINDFLNKLLQLNVEFQR